MMVDLKKGTVIKCPECKKELFALKDDFIPGVTIVSCSLLEPFSGVPEPIDGQKAACFACGADLYNIFTKKVKG